MERLKKTRRPLRAAVTKTVNEASTELEKPEPNHRTLRDKLEKLEEIAPELIALDHEVLNALLDEDGPEELVDEETSTVDEYKDKIRNCKSRINDVLYRNNGPASPTPSEYSTASGGTMKRNFKLPKIELKKFNGDLKEWLGFWSQFEKIHEDDSLHASDKFHYLVQAMEQGSEARDLVLSYPQTGSNYPEAVAALKERFGRQGILLQVYIRELLKLVINNAIQKKGYSLTTLHLKLESHLRALGSLNLTAADPSSFIFPLVESSLPEETLRAWQRSPLSKKDGSKEDPPKSNLDYLREFIKLEVQSEQQIDLARTGFQNDMTQSVGKKDNKGHKKSIMESDIPTIAGLHIGTDSKSCLFCNRNNHESKDCRKAKPMTIKEKEDKIKEAKACLRCLKPGHFAKNCKSSKFLTCLVCNGKHHVVMCPNIHKNKNVQEEEQTQAVNLNINKGVLLETLTVNLVGADGRHQSVRVFLDRGSMRSFIRKSTANELRFKPVGTQVIAKTLLGGVTVEPKEHNLYQVQMEDLLGKNKQELLLTEQDPIICQLPKIPDGPWIQELKRKKIWLSDFNYSGSTGIDVLIGADQISKILTNKTMRLKCGLVATETIFGWVLMGTLPREENIGAILCSHMKDENLTNLWELEVLGIRDPIEVETEAVKEEEAKKSFQQNLKRALDGRYSVGLPWISETPQIPTNRVVAEKRLVNMSKSLQTKGQFQTYDKIFKSWLSEGLIEQVDDTKVDKCHYLPHRPVFNEKSLTTPCRPVFDASCKVGRNPSLNECLYTGPNKITFLPAVLMGFRQKAIGITSDIRKAFMMINVNEEDRDFLRFLWWENDRTEQLKIFRHCRVVFGINSSPFLLAATIEHHLKSYKGEMQPVAEKLLKSLYVDNCVTSENSYAAYNKFRENTTRMMLDANMDLRQWECSGETTGNGSQTVLGILWDKQADTLKCEVPSKPDKITKRNILSVLHKVFDPIGHLCPALLIPKKILQETWIQKLGWDEDLSEEMKSSFDKWSDQLPELKEITIPRQVCYAESVENTQIHMFSDASQFAYAAVIFVRSKTPEGVKVQLVQAKNRVAPLKKSTINRMELLGCWMGANLTTTIIEALDLQQTQVFYWTDSTTALAWIRRNDSWGTFVGNRVKKIVSVSSSQSWRHVPGILNPADLPSRGCTPAELKDSNWWEGPEWLRRPMEYWPSSEPIYDEEEIKKEIKKSELVSVEYEEPRFSSYSKNVKVFGWMNRFINNCRKSKSSTSDIKGSWYLTIKEMRVAEIDLIRTVQKETMPEDADMIFGLRVEKLDGLYRVVTRLDHGRENFSFKKPILIPKHHPLVGQLIHGIHRIYNHAGAQFVMGKIREKYWIPQSRKTIRSVLRKCVICRRWDSKKTEVEPSALPEKRITTGEVFQTTGVDLAGPLQLKDGSKVWIVLYTCAVYRCIHLDLVTSLSTDAFLKSLERFINTEGRPNNIFTDNGTNFVGAANLLNMVNWQKMEGQIDAKSISWTFNPPTAAWWGGWWERLVRSVKDLLRRTLGNAKLTYDELRTALSSASLTINGRPLAALTEDEGDLIPLTPSMFLRGLPMKGFPESDQITQKDLQSNYKRINQLKKQFQTRFRNEYLSQLVQRHRKREPSKLRVGDIVLLGADNIKRCFWPLAKIIEMIPGRDGKVRLAKVKTSNSILLRPLRRIYSLEVPNLEEIPKPNPEVEENAKAQEMIRKREEEDAASQVNENPIYTQKGRKVVKPDRYSDWNN